jgi:N-acyl-D-amino-acid deacylase
MKTIRFFAFICLAASAAASFQENGMWDLVILGGRILDGSGERIYAADIGIQNGKIASVGRLQKDGRRKIDARGYWVVPGFIDMHSRCDPCLQDEAQMLGDLSQGVTLALFKDCAVSGKDVSAKLVAGEGKQAWDKTGECLERAQQKGLVLNAGWYADLDSISASVIGREKRPANQSELLRIRNLAAESMNAGALGLSCELNEGASGYLRKQGLTELAGTVKEHGGIYSMQLSNKLQAPIDELPEYISVAETSRIGVEIHCLHSAAEPQQINSWIREIELARKQGLDISASVSMSPKILFSIMSPEVQKEGEMLLRLLKLPWVTFGYVSSETADKSKEQIETRFFTFPALIGLYAREQRNLDPSEMIRKLTWIPAQRLNLKNRGKIAVGMAADIAIFKPETVSNRQNYGKFNSDFKAMQWVVVNGNVAIEEGKYSGLRSGKIIYGSGFGSRSNSLQ